MSEPVRPPIDRRAAFAAGAPPIPRKTILVGAVVLAGIAIAGVLGDHFLGTPGAPPPATAAIAAPTSPGGPAVNASLPAFMGLSTPRPTPAPGFALVDQQGRATRLSSLRGHVVVLTFFDARCRDDCPVLARELSVAAHDLGRSASSVDLVTVNTNPGALGLDAARLAPLEAGLATLPHWYFLTGPLNALNTVWSSYHVTIDYLPKGDRTSHNDVVDFIDPSGRIRYVATPVADESPSGVASLPVREIDRFGLGIAIYARRLLPA